MNNLKILSIACLFIASGLLASSSDRPNILWISCEDMSARHLSIFGNTLSETPNIGRLAKEGMLFTRAFTTAGVCAPSRSGIITGMYQTSIGTQNMRTSKSGPGLPTPYEAVPPHYVKTFTEYLRAAGYYCTNNAKEDYQFKAPVTACPVPRTGSMNPVPTCPWWFAGPVKLILAASTRI